MKCPRCQSLVSATPDASGLVLCPSCGARLRSKSAPSPPAATRPPGTPPPSFARSTDVESTLVARRGAAPKDPAQPEAPAAPSPMGSVGEQILNEIRALRESQEEILSLLRARPTRSEPEPLFQEPALHGSLPSSSSSSSSRADDDAMPAPPPVVRSRRRKTVVVMDDDPAARAEAQAALEKAEVPVRVVGDGNAGLAAIAQEKPDVIVLELDLGGAMPGRDVVNMIKATMEWIDIPIVLYTRLPIENQKEARQVHGADEIVRKGAGGAEALVARVISVFRRG
jgi:CheY-like chemotaxis protein